MMFKVNDIVVVNDTGYMRAGEAGMIVGGPDKGSMSMAYSDKKGWLTRWWVMFPDGEELSFRETSLTLVSSA